MTEKNQPSVSPAQADRRSFLRRSLLVGAAATPIVAASTATPAKAEFVRNQLRNEFAQIRRHENDHVEFLVGLLGADARPKPTFQNLERPTFINFARIARILENTGVGAYTGAAPAIDSSTVLAGAATIALIEGRHAGVLNFLDDSFITANVKEPNADQSFELPLTAAEVRDLAAPFIQDLNGGPPIDYSTTPSAQNDIDILNFALALEYLEADFYNINVPKFYQRRP